MFLRIASHPIREPRVGHYIHFCSVYKIAIVEIVNLLLQFTCMSVAIFIWYKTVLMLRLVASKQKQIVYAQEVQVD